MLYNTEFPLRTTGEELAHVAHLHTGWFAGAAALDIVATIRLAQHYMRVVTTHSPFRQPANKLARMMGKTKNDVAHGRNP